MASDDVQQDDGVSRNISEKSLSCGKRSKFFQLGSLMRIHVVNLKFGFLVSV